MRTLIRPLGVFALLAACDAAHDVSTDDTGGGGAIAPATDARSGADAGGDALIPGADAALPGDAAPPRPADASPDAGPTPDAARPVSDARAPDGASAPADAAPPLDVAPFFVDSGERCPDGLPPRRFFPDTDNDGYGDVVDLSGDPASGCEPPAGYVSNALDCDDRRAETNPAASETCNALDDDCDGVVDNRAVDNDVFYADTDGDGFGDLNGEPAFACEVPEGYADNFDDCHDGDPAIGRCGAEEICSALSRCLPRGQCDGGRDCPDGMICNDMGACEPGSPCGGESYGASRVVPNLLIVLDRSCSMRARVNGVRKWQAAVDAIVALTRQYEGQIRFGLELFPDLVNPSCGQSEVIVPLADASEGRIRDLLTAALAEADRFYPDGPCVTNIDTAIELASQEPRLLREDETGYVMLVTDGRQSSCDLAGSDAGTERIIGELNGRGVSTFVVGFGGEVDAAQLDAFALAGGVPRADAPRYYQADDAAGLQAALQNIGRLVASCDYVLAEQPPNPFDLHVFFDNQEEVPRDAAHGQGWDYDPATVTISFYGAPCDRLTAGEVRDVDVVFGCLSM